ncbi:MAG: glycosyl hydrolase family 18 protein, partial [Chitinophagales bacterium]
AVAPLDGYLSLKTTLNNYLASGVDASKFIMAVPYYGREWKTRSSGVPATTSSYVKAPTYTHIKNSYYPNYTVKWDDKSATHYVVRKVSGTIRQCWFDSEESLGRKYDLALENDIGGVGMWALGYDHGHHDLWDLLEDKFTQCRDEEYQDISTQEEPKPLYQRIIEDYFDYDN